MRGSDRSLPSCLLCTKLHLICVYPTLRLKPGPKGDSSQRLLEDLSTNGDRKSSIGRSSWRKDHVSYLEGNGCDFSLCDEDSPNEHSAESYDIQSNSTDVESNFVKAIGLSALIHPTHDLCLLPVPMRQETTSSGSLLNLAGAQNLLMDACIAFDLSLEGFQHLTDIYFDSMTEFSLFHRPSFGNKIQNIKNPGHLQAFFASMFAYSASFHIDDAVDLTAHIWTSSCTPDPMRFHNLALRLINTSLDECSDQPPSICLLQAMILITFCELTKGVRGRAWRLLGSCVRVAYELHLHLIDYEARDEYYKVGQDLSRWIADEERRRCWWAIWKMDNFASVIRRCPTAIDWNMIDTYLPVSDELWFNNQFQRSCLLEREPTTRAEILKSCGNEGADAWLIVISSIMRDAQVLLRGNLRGVLLDVDPHNASEQLLHYFHNSFCRKKTDKDSTRLKTLIRALRTTISSLPKSLVYNGEYLDFGFDFLRGVRDSETKRLHSAKYNIHLTMNLAQFMVYHHYAFGEIVSGVIFTEKDTKQEVLPQEERTSENALGLEQCLQAADYIYILTSHCPEDHVKYVNPFLASTVWLSASLQVLRKLFGKKVDLEETLSKYAILRATCERFTAFWHTPLALLENLDSLEARLSPYCNFPPGTTAPHEAPHGLNMPMPFSVSGETRVQKPSTRTNRPKTSQQDLQPLLPRADGDLNPISEVRVSPTAQYQRRDNENSSNANLTPNPPLHDDYNNVDQSLSSGQNLPTSAWREDTEIHGGLDNWFPQCLSDIFTEAFGNESVENLYHGP
ncbi:Fungal specific transcription factor [Penicillium cosmopolitanum]|uniref:Fungal specific transcription factor n=1 Tax=Penicillium cosmopolitanum TaxID=1131564 RepID=A0A9W9SIS9_9EURO|nr:Fungal specific transcription factor [Penicillium cosmopolitanum]KAJ5379386.1 Fungal specific transcription factor [Penicillium cosmopolitanum]